VRAVRLFQPLEDRSMIMPSEHSAPESITFFAKPERSSRLDRAAQHIAGRNLRDPEASVTKAAWVLCLRQAGQAVSVA
jgi:hypothetical protein